MTQPGSRVMVSVMVRKSQAPVPRSIPAGEFKAKCLELMDRVQATGSTLVITKRGRPIARLVPALEPRDTLAGFFAGKIEILGDIVEPLDLEFRAFR